MLAPSFQSLLEKSIKAAIAENQQLIGVARFLGGMLTDDDAVEFLRNCGADVPKLESLIVDAIDTERMEKPAATQDLLNRVLHATDPVTLLADESSGLPLDVRMGLIGNDPRLVEYYRNCVKRTLQSVTEVVRFREENKIAIGGSENFVFGSRLERTLLRAAYAMASAEQESLHEGDVLAAMFAERDSFAVILLEDSGVFRLDVLVYISHKLSKLDEQLSNQVMDPLSRFLDFFRSYRVLMHKDNYTSNDFVSFMLTTVFAKTDDQAHVILMKIHKDGKAVVGAYPSELANGKVKLVIDTAREREFPFLCTLERMLW